MTVNITEYKVAGARIPIRIELAMNFRDVEFRVEEIELPVLAVL